MVSVDGTRQPYPRSLRFGRASMWGAGVVCAVVVLICLFAYRAQSHLIEANRWTAHTHEVIAEARGAKASLRAASAETRLFVTGILMSRETIDRELGALSNHLQRLESSTADNVQQTERIRAITRLVASCSETLRSVAAAKATTTDASADELLSRIPATDIRQASAMLDDVEAVEEALLTPRQATADRSEQLSRLLLFTGCITVFAVLSGTMIMLWREGWRRMALEQGLRDAAHVAEQANIALSELNARLETANQGLTAANKELEAFSYTVSHDLRAPLRSIDGFSRILIEEHAPNLPPEGTGYLKRVRAGAQQMGLLIDDLLAFSRLGRQHMRTHGVDLQAMTRTIVEQLKSEAPTRSIDATIGAMPPVVGDAALLRQVMSNLVANAFKFTRTREPARIHAGYDHAHKAFFVRDNGVGFDMRYADKLFGVFQRLHRADEFEGTGVGLAIVQRIIHRHGGRVWAEAKPGDGAVFWFTLPGETTA